MKQELLSKVGRYEFLSEPSTAIFPIVSSWGIWAIIC